MKLQQIGEINCSYKMGNGQSIRFWNDVWHGTCSLACAYFHLYQLCTNPNVSLQKVLRAQGHNIDFKRSLHGVLLSEWQELIKIITLQKRQNTTDCSSWNWESKGNFYVVTVPK